MTQGGLLHLCCPPLQQCGVPMELYLFGRAVGDANAQQRRSATKGLTGSNYGGTLFFCRNMMHTVGVHERRTAVGASRADVISKACH